MNIKYLLILFLLCGIFRISHAQNELTSCNEFKFNRQLQRDGDDNYAYYVCSLDSDIYKQTDQLQTGILLSENTPVPTPIPFLLKPVLESRIQNSEILVPGQIVYLKNITDKLIMIEFELNSPAVPVMAIDLDTTENFFKKYLSVQVGNHNQWETVIARKSFSNYNNSTSINRCHFTFDTPSWGNKIRIWITDDPQFTSSLTPPDALNIGSQEAAAKAMRIDAIRAYKLEKVVITDKSPKKFNWPLQLFSSKINQESQELIFASGREPLTAIEIRSTNPEYQRQMVWSGSNDQESWQPLTSGTISSSPDIKDSQIQFPESRFNYYKLEIFYGNHPLLNNITVRAQGINYNLIILQNNAAPQLILCYGGGVNSNALLIPERYYEKIKNQPNGQYTLGNINSNPDYALAQFNQNDQYWLIISSAVLILLIILFLFRKKINHLQ